MQSLFSGQNPGAVCALLYTEARGEVLPEGAQQGWQKDLPLLKRFYSLPAYHFF